MNPKLFHPRGIHRSHALWGYRDIGTGKQKSSSAIRLEVEIALLPRRLHKPLHATIEADRILIVLLRGSDKTILHVEADENSRIIIKQSGPGALSMAAAALLKTRYFRDSGLCPRIQIDRDFQDAPNQIGSNSRWYVGKWMRFGDRSVGVSSA